MSARPGRYPTRFDGQGPTATVAPPLAPEVDVELLALLDPEHDLECVVNPCEHHADWYRRCRSCGALYAVCEQHHQQELAWFPTQLMTGCADCGDSSPGPLWFMTFEYLPIGVDHGA